MGTNPNHPLFLPRNIKEARLFHKQGFLKLAGYVSTSLVERPPVFPLLSGERRGSLSCTLGLKELNDPSETLSLTYWCGNNARAAAALCFGLEDTGGTTG